jgi:hypothetical protein
MRFVLATVIHQIQNQWAKKLKKRKEPPERRQNFVLNNGSNSIGRIIRNRLI